MHNFHPHTGVTGRNPFETGNNLASASLPGLSGAERNEAFAVSPLQPQVELNYLSLKQCLGACEELGMSLLDSYYERFSQVFRNEDERSSKAEIVRDLRARDNFDVKIAMANGQIVGGSHYWLFELTDYAIGFEEHIWVSPEFRGARVGKALYEAVLQDIKSGGADAIMGELKDPFLMSESEKCPGASQMDPAARVQMWKKLGRLAIDAPYTQPSLRPGARPIDNMMLTIEAFNSTLTQFTPEQYLELLQVYTRHIKGGWDDANDPLIEAVAPVVRSRGVVPFIPVDEPRSHIRKNL